jgi:hypothetical protein
MTTWNDTGYETDATRLFVRDRSRQRIDDSQAERFAHEIYATRDESAQPVRAHWQRRWRLAHIRQPHFNH